MNKRRALLLGAWTIAWLALPAFRPLLIAAVTGSLFAYLALQFRFRTL